MGRKTHNREMESVLAGAPGVTQEPEREGSAVSTQGLYSSWSFWGHLPRGPECEQACEGSEGVSQGQLGKQREKQAQRG